MKTGIRLVLLMCLGWPVVAAGQAPGHLTMLVGYPAGGSADVTARIIAENLGAELGQTIIVENRVGAGGQLAARALKNANPDGSVLMMSNSHTFVTVPLTTKEPGFSTSTDFRPIAGIGTYALALAVHPKTGARSLDQFVAWLKANPREANIAIPAAASAPEFLIDRMRRHFGFDAQIISYRGSAPAIQDLLGGQVSAAVVPVTDLLPYLNDGQMTVLAATRRTRLLPKVPSLGESGLDGLDVSEFYAVYAPASLPDALADRYSTAIRQILSNSKIADRFESLGIEIDPTDPERQKQVAQTLSGKISELIKTSGFKPQ